MNHMELCVAIHAWLALRGIIISQTAEFLSLEPHYTLSGPTRVNMQESQP